MNELEDLVQWLQEDPRIHTNGCSSKAAKKGLRCQLDCTCYVTQKRLQAELALRYVKATENVTERLMQTLAKAGHDITELEF